MQTHVLWTFETPLIPTMAMHQTEVSFRGLPVRHAFKRRHAARDAVEASARWRAACLLKRMRWTPGGDSSDIEDRRGESGGGGGGFNFGGFSGLHLGIGGTLVLIVFSLLLRTNLFDVIGGGTAAPTAAVRPLSNPDADPAEKREVEFVTFVLNDVQHTWEQLLPQAGTSYRHTKLVLFRDSHIPDAAAPKPKPDPSTAPSMRRSISISASSRNCATASEPQANSHRPTCWHTKSVITCKNCWGPRRKYTASRAVTHRRRIRSRSAWSYRRIATPESGATLPNSAKSPMMRT